MVQCRVSFSLRWCKNDALILKSIESFRFKGGIHFCHAPDMSYPSTSTRKAHRVHRSTQFQFGMWPPKLFYTAWAGVWTEVSNYLRQGKRFPLPKNGSVLNDLVNESLVNASIMRTHTAACLYVIKFRLFKEILTYLSSIIHFFGLQVIIQLYL